jgi:hypothetical protein
MALGDDLADFEGIGHILQGTDGLFTSMWTPSTLSTCHMLENPPILEFFKLFLLTKGGRPHLGHFMIVVGFYLSHLDDVEVTYVTLHLIR